MSLSKNLKTLLRTFSNIGETQVHIFIERFADILANLASRILFSDSDGKNIILISRNSLFVKIYLHFQFYFVLSFLLHNKTQNIALYIYLFICAKYIKHQLSIKYSQSYIVIHIKTLNRARLFNAKLSVIYFDLKTYFLDHIH